MSSVIEKQAGRAIFAVGVIFALLLSAMFINSANANATFDFTRYEGADRYATAKAIAEATYPSGTAKAIIASGVSYPDALAASFLAGNIGGPVLLTLPSTLSASAKTALSTLKVKDVTIVGGTGAVSQAVEDELKATDSTASGGGKLNVVRIAGANRYESAKKIAEASGTTVGTVGGKKTAIVARGDDFPDALAGGPLGYSGKFPVLLTEGAPATLVNGFTKAALNTLAIEHVLILGGTGAITSGTEQDIKDARGSGLITTERLGGSSRTETARLIAEWARTNLAFVNTHVDMARGDGFADALAGAAHAGVTKSPILLTVNNNILSLNSTTGAKKYLTDNQSTLADGHIYGGVGAVSMSVEREAETAAGNTNPSPSGSASGSGSPSPSASPSPSPSFPPGPPQVQDLRAVDGGSSVPTVADAGDYLQFVFTKPMAATTDDVGQSFTLRDGDGTERTYVCGTEVNCVLQLAGSFDSCDTTPCVANQVLRVKIVTTPTGGTAGTVPTMAYLSATLTAVSSGWKDGANQALDITNSADVAANNAAMTPAPATTAPSPSSASGVASTQTVTLTYDRPMTCLGTEPAQVAIVGSPDKPAGALQCPKTVTVTASGFAAGTLVAGNAAQVKYTQSATQANRLMDLDGNFAAASTTDFTPTAS
jgi:putative cell wall-binding protein